MTSRGVPDPVPTSMFDESTHSQPRLCPASTGAAQGTVIPTRAACDAPSANAGAALWSQHRLDLDDRLEPGEVVGVARVER